MSGLSDSLPRYATIGAAIEQGMASELFRAIPRAIHRPGLINDLVAASRTLYRWTGPAATSATQPDQPGDMSVTDMKIKTASLAALIGTMLLLNACATVKGAGRDIQSVGQAGEDAIKRK